MGVAHHYSPSLSFQHSAVPRSLCHPLYLCPMSSCSSRSSSGNNLPLLAQEGRSSPWPRLSQSSTISYSTLITFISSSSLSKSRSSVCHQGDVWHVLYVAFNCIDKPDKIVRLTGNWTEGGISLFEWSIHTKLAEVCIQILKSVISVSLKLVV